MRIFYFRSLWPLFVLTLYFSGLSAAGAQVTGRVLDEAGVAVPYANVAVHLSADSSLLTGTTSDVDGLFSMDLEPGGYFLKISFLSYRELVVPGLEVTGGPMDLGDLVLTVESELLDEVVIVSERSQLELRLDKKVFNVGKDLSTTGGTAADLLDRVPSVTVDVEGNVSLRGSGNVRILVNGKPSGLVSSGDPQSLRQLQGNLIESIEVITNPSSRFDAEGEVGIINLVLKEQRQRGVHGSLDLTTGYPHDHGAAINMNYRRNAVNIFLSEGISFDRNPGEGRSFQEYFYADTAFAYERLRDQSRSDLSNNFRLGADFYVTPKDIITLSGLYQYATGDNISSTFYNDFNAGGDQVNRVERYQDEEETEHSVEADLQYRKEFDQKDRLFTADVRFNLSKDRETAAYTEQDFGTGPELDARQRSDNLEYEKIWLAQADYAHPFGNEGLVEAGLKGTWRTIENDFLVEEAGIGGIYAPIAGFDNNFVYNEDIYALYLQARETFGAFSLQAGLRTEYSVIRTELVRTGESNPRDYVDFFPSVFTGYKFRERNTLQAGYSRRISRPNFWSLAPFFQYAETRDYRSGNPGLEPEYTHSAEFGYQRILDKGSFLTTLYYRNRSGVITRITFVDEAEDITRSIPINLATANDVGLEASLNMDLFDWWTATGNMNAYRSVTKGSYEGEDLGSETYALTLQLSSKFRIARRLNLQASYQYNSPRNTAQGRVLSQWFIDLGANMEVMKGRGNITLSVRDLFDTRTRRWITEGSNFRTEGDFQWRSGRQVALGFNFRLNKED